MTNKLANINKLFSIFKISPDGYVICKKIEGDKYSKYIYPLKRQKVELRYLHNDQKLWFWEDGNYINTSLTEFYEQVLIEKLAGI